MLTTTFPLFAGRHRKSEIIQFRKLVQKIRLHSSIQRCGFQKAGPELVKRVRSGESRRNVRMSTKSSKPKIKMTTKVTYWYHRGQRRCACLWAEIGYLCVTRFPRPTVYTFSRGGCAMAMYPMTVTACARRYAAALPAKVCATAVGLVTCLYSSLVRQPSVRPSEAEPFRQGVFEIDDMRVLCSDKVHTLVDPATLSRSKLLADMHGVDPEGSVRVPCDTKTWTTWLTDDPSQLPADTTELMLAVIMVRSLCTQEVGSLQVPSHVQSLGYRRRCSGQVLLEADFKKCERVQVVTTAVFPHYHRHQEQ
jgi:hypothetical protein